MTDSYAVVGNPIEHSISPTIHKLFAEELNQDITYEKILSPITEFKQVVGAFQKKGGLGMNVTVPFKQEASELAGSSSDRVRESGVANVLIFKAGIIQADNTDGVGLVNDIQKNLDFGLLGKDVLVLGAGGAACGVIGPILREKPRGLTIANRTQSRASLLVDKYCANYPMVSGVGLDQLKGREYHLVINATSSSLQGNALALPHGLFAPDALAYDMMYGAKAQQFLRLCSKQGARYISDGLGMLVEQAAESFFLWRDVRPDSKTVLDKLRKN